MAERSQFAKVKARTCKRWRTHAWRRITRAFRAPGRDTAARSGGRKRRDLALQPFWNNRKPPSLLARRACPGLNFRQISRSTGAGTRLPR